MDYNAAPCSQVPIRMETDECQTTDTCTKVGKQYADIAFSMEVKPNVHIGSIDLSCCGEPHIECNYNCCSDSIELNITQKLQIKIPLQYQVTTCFGDKIIYCEEP